MSNRLDDSVGSELIADDEKSINERMKGNQINAYKIKMKSDLQKAKNDNYLNNLENRQFTQNLNFNNYVDKDSFISKKSKLIFFLHILISLKKDLHYPSWFK